MGWEGGASWQTGCAKEKKYFLEQVLFGIEENKFDLNMVCVLPGYICVRDND